MIFLSSCNTIKYLEEDETLLKKNEFLIDDDFKDTRKPVLESDLTKVLQTKPNEKILGLFRTPLWYYYNTQSSDDTTVFDNWVRNNYAEPPSLIDSSQISEDTENIVSFLVRKGYRNASAYYTILYRQKKGIVFYHVDPGQKWIMDSVSIFAVDPIIDSILQANTEESFLKANQAFDEISFSLEKNRITELLQNLGYYNFSSNFILAQADTSNNQLATRLIVTNPAEGKHHRFWVRNISIYSDIADLLQESEINQVGQVHGFRFFSTENDFYIEPRIIAQNIRIRPGEYYKKDDLVNTRNKLNRLAIVKLVTVRTNIEGDSLDFSLYIPRNKKIVQETNFDVNYSTFNRDVGRSLFGLSGSTNFRNKNVFGGGETLLTNLELGADINLSQQDSFGLFNSFHVRVQNDLSFPRFIDALGLLHLMNKVRIGQNGLLRDQFLNRMEDDGITKLSVIYDFLSLTDFYNRHQLAIYLNYEVTSQRRLQYRIGQMGINLWVPTQIKSGFQSILDNNLYVKNSFGTRLFTGFIFNNFQFNYISPVKRLGNYWTIIGNAELSGHEISLVDALIDGPRDTLRLGNNIEFAKFGKVEIDVRRHFQLSPNQSLVFRLNTGVGFPYSTSNSVPYVKQFFVGGPFSLRAWRVRELGPGGYIDSFALNIENPSPIFYYQTGDFKLELNLEYRFPMLWRFEGAFFIDAGNVWSLRSKEQDNRENSKLTWNFYDQIAIGSGFGLRTDFEYFILRLDVGTKIRNPYKIDGRHYPYRNFSQAMSLNNLNFNIALDYPF